MFHYQISLREAAVSYKSNAVILSQKINCLFGYSSCKHAWIFSPSVL